jgi:hypothetical protein
MAKVCKCPCRHVAGVGGQYKMYNSLIFINFISRSKKVKPKSKSCIKHLFTVNKLLRLWYFVSVLNLKFLDQLEKRHCKDTPFFRPFYIGAPKGPFLWGLRNVFYEKLTEQATSIIHACMYCVEHSMLRKLNYKELKTFPIVTYVKCLL